MLERLSTTDALTGLGNRLGFDRRMHELLEHPGLGDITLMLLDLDRFKLVNDSLGHQVGDRLLVEVARRLVAAVPRGLDDRADGWRRVRRHPAGRDVGGSRCASSPRA